MPTTDELQIRIDQMNVRIIRLPSVSQIDELRDLLIAYKAETDQRIGDLEDENEFLRAQVQNLEERVQTLEA